MNANRITPPAGSRPEEVFPHTETDPVELHAVTGAFGYSGKHIAALLLQKGREVITLTHSPRRESELSGQIKAFPFNFEHPEQLAETLQGVKVLYNTYWVRFNHPGFSFEQAVHNSKILFEAARQSGVERIVHVSISNPSMESPFEYFRGKARVEQALSESGISYAILRPAVIFGQEDILINNIAWSLRHLPVFGYFGDGQYRIQPIYVEDLAKLAVQYGQTRENIIVPAIGPESFTYRDLAATIAALLGIRRPIVSVPSWFGYLAGQIIGALMHDVTVTWEEIGGLMADLLYVDAPPTGSTRLTDWIKQHADDLGRSYASELSRRTDRITRYS